MESAMSSDTMIEFSGSMKQEVVSLPKDSTSFLSTLTPRKEVLAILCEEIKQGQLTAVNSLFGPYGFSVNPEFLNSWADRLRIMRDIEIALNELDDESILVELGVTEMEMSLKS